MLRLAPKPNRVCGISLLLLLALALPSRNGDAASWRSVGPKARKAAKTTNHLFRSVVLRNPMEMKRVARDAPVLAVATTIALQRSRNPVRFLRTLLPFAIINLKLATEMQHSEGLVRFGFQLDFFRLSASSFTVWETPDAALKFVHSPTHVQAMRRLDNWAEDGTKATRWGTTNNSAQVNWDVAHEKLNVPSTTYRPEEGIQHHAPPLSAK